MCDIKDNVLLINYSNGIYIINKDNYQIINNILYDCYHINSIF